MHCSCHSSLQWPHNAGMHVAAAEGGQSAGSSDADAVIGAARPSPSGHETFVQVEQLQQGLCGRSRPHFFRGVATVIRA